MHRRQGLKVAFLTRYDRIRASSRVRVYDYLPYLEQMGWQYRVLPFPKRLSLATKLGYVAKAIWLARWADVVVLQKLVLREQFVDLLKQANARLVFDFDDALWAPPDMLANDEQVQQHYEIQKERLHYLIRQARCVIAGSQYLADYARSFALSVHVLPSSVDLTRYPMKPIGDDSGTVVFGWIGSPENLMDFRPVHSALREAFSTLNGRAVLKIVSTRPLKLAEVPIQFEPWALNKDTEFLHSFDVGLMPLQNTERSRGRCAFKAIQYMAVGLPVLASPVGAATEVLVHGETGLLLGSDEEWKEAFLRLSRDTTLRRRMGAAGRARVETLFSVQVNAPKLAFILREVAQS